MFLLYRNQINDLYGTSIDQCYMIGTLDCKRNNQISYYQVRIFVQLFQQREEASYDIENQTNYPGVGSKLRFINQLNIIDPDDKEGLPVYQVLDRKGVITNQEEDPQVSEFALVALLIKASLKWILITRLICKSFRR